MDSDEKKLGGGAGGGPTDHADFRDVNGDFERQANRIILWTHPDDASGNVSIAAQGSLGRLVLMGHNQVSVGTKPGEFKDDPSLMSKTQPGVVIYAPDDGDQILIQRGEDVGSSQFIQFAKDFIHIQAGEGGQLLLSAGNSYIKISPAGITMKGTLIQIN
jgi:hypothetical protein